VLQTELKINAEKYLKRYWGYDSFRPGQLELITPLLEKKDVVGILPTGGGKSLCYQLPGLMLDGITLVISPLIALMQDQVESLKAIGLKAETIHSGLSRDAIDRIFNNARLNKLDFLYVSPERVLSELGAPRFNKLNITLLAIDEAHCISQWGHDFRPSYLELAQLREEFVGVPMIALSATATKPILEDIITHLNLQDPVVKQTSFFRPELSYSVFQVEHKMPKLLQVIDKVQGTTIVYVPTRRRADKLAFELNLRNYSATSYHAGLDANVRGKNQAKWLANKSRIMVATSAFGMGIDKPDVRLVVHYGIPPSPEAYFQEAGRAGRDKQKAYAVLLYEASDLKTILQNNEFAYPSIEKLKTLYTTLGNYLQKSPGEQNPSFENFDLLNFSNKSGFDSKSTYFALKALEQHDLIELNSDFFKAPKIKILAKRQIIEDHLNSTDQSIIEHLLRKYEGISSILTNINPTSISKSLNLELTELAKRLNQLAQNNIVEYIPISSSAQLRFNNGFQHPGALIFKKKRYKNLKDSAFNRMNAMLNYLQHEVCRQQFIFEYFEQPEKTSCGICDICRNRHDGKVNKKERNEIIEKIKNLLTKNPKSLPGMLSNFEAEKEHIIIQSLDDLMKEEIISRKDGLFYWQN